MDKPKTPSIKELKKELANIDERLKEKCALCRIVLGLSMGIFIVVALYALVDTYNKNRNAAPELLAPENYPIVDPAVSDREILELAQIFHPELATTSSYSATTTSLSGDTLSN